MPNRRANELSDLEIDEISTVDSPANQHGRVVLAKRANEEDSVPDFYDEDGKVVDTSVLKHGQVVFDGEGDAFIFDETGEFDQDDKSEDEPAAELVGAGVSKAFAASTKQVGKSLADEVRESLSKALTDADRDEVISKALSQVDGISKRLEEAEKIAKTERDTRLTREYTDVAKNFGLAGVDPGQLGPVLMRAADALSFEDCKVLAKSLKAAGERTFDEVGYRGNGDNVDVFQAIEAFANEAVAKSEGNVGAADAISKAFESNDELYDEYLRARRQA